MPNGNAHPILLGRTDAVANQIFMACYSQLVPVVAAAKLQAGYAGAADPQAIADEAWSIAVAAVAKIGINVEEKK